MLTRSPPRHRAGWCRSSRLSRQSERCSCGSPLLPGSSSDHPALGLLLPLRLDPVEENRRGFIVRVLRDEVARKGFLQDGLPEGLGLEQMTVDLGNYCVGCRQANGQSFDYDLLFAGAAQWNDERLDFTGVYVVNAASRFCLDIRFESVADGLKGARQGTQEAILRGCFEGESDSRRRGIARLLWR